MRLFKFSSHMERAAQGQPTDSNDHIGHLTQVADQWRQCPRCKMRYYGTGRLLRIKFVKPDLSGWQDAVIVCKECQATIVSDGPQPIV